MPNRVWQIYSNIWIYRLRIYIHTFVCINFSLVHWLVSNLFAWIYSDICSWVFQSEKTRRIFIQFSGQILIRAFVRVKFFDTNISGYVFVSKFSNRCRLYLRQDSETKSFSIQNGLILLIGKFQPSILCRFRPKLVHLSLSLQISFQTEPLSWSWSMPGQSEEESNLLKMYKMEDLTADSLSWVLHFLYSLLLQLWVALFGSPCYMPGRGPTMATLANSTNIHIW